MSAEPTGFRNCVMIGLGYIGLPTAAVIAKHGIDVVGVDVNQGVVDSVNKGECPITEPGLPELLKDVVGKGALKAQTKPAKADVFLIAVPTPFEGGYNPDLSFVESATRSIAEVLERGNLVILESTVPVGTTEQIGRWLAEMRPDLTFSTRGMTADDRADVLIAHCPERIMPGQMLRELIENDRLIGGVCPRAQDAGRDFYESFVRGKCLVTDVRTAEMAKLTENAFRDVNIAFANELATISRQLDIDVWKLIEMANHHPRVNILQPGPGVGGHCIAVDPWFIVSAFGEEARLIREARWINSSRPRHVIRDVLHKIETGEVSRVACFGLSYKANIDDLRESPAVTIADQLAMEIHFRFPNVELLAVEPHVEALPKQFDGKPIRLADVEEGLSADLIVMLVDHDVFKRIDSGRLQGKTLVDTRGVWRDLA